ncbi:MAG: response regulator, partial [Deltaproteobacteria bacterium]|nr:response regulator [Deltaproteobacteria bacterium]
MGSGKIGPFWSLPFRRSWSCLWLPRASWGQAVIRKTSSFQNRRINAMTEEKENILLVDDEKKFLDTISERIRLKGFEPLQASSGKEALEIARKQKIYAAVVDLKMPDMDGLVTITKLKE